MKAKGLQVQISERHVDSSWSWIVCVSSFFIQFLIGGFHNSFGTFFVALLDKYGRSEAETAWIGSLAIGLTYLCGPFSTYLCHRFGCRIVACTGSVLLLISGLLTSIVNQMIWMYLTFGVLNGLASSMLYFSSLVVLIEYFHKHLSLANGIAVAGSGVGTLVINMIAQALISKFGLQNTFKAMAGLSAISFFAGLTFSPIKSAVTDEPLKQREAHQPKSFVSKCKAALKPGEQWENKGFIAWAISMGLILFACYIPSVYLVRIARDLDVPASKGGLLVGFLAISQTLGKITFGKVADFRGVNRLTIVQMALLVTSVATCMLPLAKSYGALVTYTVVQGFFDGCYVVLIGLVTHDIVGKRLMADAVGSVYFVVSIPMTMGPPVAGMFYDHLGSYDAVFFLSSAFVCTGICIMFLIPWLTPPTLPNALCDKQVLLSMEDKLDQLDDHQERYDLSYVDEQNLADLFGRKNGRDLLLERNRALMDGSCATSRPSSFVLFTIISDEHHRDISAYTSRQELAFASCATTPLRGTPSTRRRHHDPESHTSMFSLRQSYADVAQPESIPDTASDEQAVIALNHRDVTLETVEEINEARKNSREEKPTPEISLTDKSLPINEDKLLGNSSDLLKSSSQLSDGTVDSGYEECLDCRLTDKEEFPTMRHSIENFFIHCGKTKSENHSYSCNDLATLPSNECIRTVSRLKPGGDLIDKDSCFVEDNYKTFPIEFVGQETEYFTTVNANDDETEFTADRDKRHVDTTEMCYHSDVEEKDEFSLLVENVLEFEESAAEDIESEHCSIGTIYSNLYDEYRETSV